MGKITNLKLDNMNRQKSTIMIGNENSSITYIGVIDVLNALSKKIKNSNDYKESKEWFGLYMQLLKLLKESDK